MTRRHLLTLLGTAPLAAAPWWERQSFPNWTPQEVERLLTDSPWARPVTVRFEYQPPARPLRSELGLAGFQGGIGLPQGIPGVNWPRGPRQGGDRGRSASVLTEIYLTVRWSSALPIRQALALERFGRNGLEDPKAVELLQHDEKDYVVEIFGLPAILAPQGSQRLEAELLQAARIYAKGHRPLKASAAYVPEHGEHLSAELRFPRFDSVEPEDGAIEFAASSGSMEIATKFKLKTMVYQGRLAL